MASSAKNRSSLVSVLFSSCRILQNLFCRENDWSQEAQGVINGAYTRQNSTSCQWFVFVHYAEGEDIPFNIPLDSQSSFHGELVSTQVQHFNIFSSIFLRDLREDKAVIAHPLIKSESTIGAHVSELLVKKDGFLYLRQSST